MKVDAFGKTHDGRAITAFTLEGRDGACLQVLDYGGKVVRLCVPDRNGKLENFVLRGQTGELCFAARVDDPESGRRLDTWTTEPGLQLYTGFAFHDGLRDQFERPLFPFAGLALETQHYPDSVHHAHFPTTLLRPHAHYRSVTEYRFATC